MRPFFTLTLAGMLLTVPGIAQKKTQSEGTKDSAYAEAVRFERAKDAAAARQARMEAEHPCGCATPADAAAVRDGKPVSQRASNTRPKK
jgi:hypothetical protein